MAEASSGSRDGENTEEKLASSTNLTIPVHVRDREPPGISFVEFIEFLLRLFKNVFGDNSHPMAPGGYMAQVQHGMDIVAKAYDEEFRGP